MKQFNVTISEIFCRNDEKVSTRLRSLLQCNFSSLLDYIAHEKTNNVGFIRNKKWLYWCKYVNCWNPTFLTDFCQLFPFKVFKIVRVPLNTAELLLEQNLVDKVLYLVRHPKGTMSSR